MLHQCSLVFESVTLAEVVEFVVEMLVNLARGTVFDQQTTENPQTSHPHDLTAQIPSAPCVPSAIHTTKRT